MSKRIKKPFNWSKQVVLLTGGTGSFGQAFTAYLLKKHPPKLLRIFSRDEFKQHEMQKYFYHKCLRFLIGDVRDKDRLKQAMQDVTMVVHAAAMKQIVATEYNPREAIYTNILGAINVLDTTIDAGVERLLGLGTDKAVVPINLYGATKLCAEKLFIQGNVYSAGRPLISCVRYGNVAASRGSIIPLFMEQKKAGELTLTHPEMTRFWITMLQAVETVINSIESMRGGEIIVPKMPSFRLSDLADTIAPKARQKIVGIRPGEKIDEDLIALHEAPRTYDQGTYYVIYPDFPFRSISKIVKGKPVARNFHYNSRSNPQRLSKIDIAKLLKEINAAV